MNRLWVRLSIAISSLIILAVGLMVLVGVVLSQLGLITGGPPGDNVPLLVRLLNGLVFTALISVVVGISAGIWVSRTMAAPLDRLAEAAQAIGAKDLSRRVEVRGSQEVIAVSQAFNEMAVALQNAEAVRRNLIADVAHELRTPLTVLQGNLQAILDDVYPLDKEEVARLYDQTRLLIRLVNDLHELAQVEMRQFPVQPQPTDLRRLVQEAVATYAPMAEEAGVTLRADVPPEVPLINADPARLTQALQNLLSNALRHTPDAGIITIQLARETNSLRLSVRDTGSGIAAEHLPHVFDRFYRTDRGRSRDAGGAGLGLAIVKAIVEAHGGRVQAMSRGRGQGSTFVIILPL